MSRDQDKIIATKKYRGGVELRTIQGSTGIRYHVFRPSGDLAETTLVSSATFHDPKLAHEYANGLGRGFDMGVRLGRKLEAKDTEERTPKPEPVQPCSAFHAHQGHQHTDDGGTMWCPGIYIIPATAQPFDTESRLRAHLHRIEMLEARIERDAKRIEAIERFCIDDTDGPADRRRNVRLDNLETEVSGLLDHAQKTDVTVTEQAGEIGALQHVFKVSANQIGHMQELFLTHLHETSTGYTSKPHIDKPRGRREHRETRKIVTEDFT